MNHSNNKNFHQQTTSVLNMLFILDFTRLKYGLNYHKTTGSHLSEMFSFFLCVCLLLCVSLFMCLLVYCVCLLLLISSALILCFIAAEGVQNVHVAAAAAALCAHILACPACQVSTTMLMRSKFNCSSPPVNPSEMHTHTGESFVAGNSTD